MGILDDFGLNAQQKDIVSHKDGPALVLAGPGSGKTTVIIFRQCYLIFEQGVHPQSILSMTFNKQAAIEMDERFRKLLLEFEQKNFFKGEPERYMVECCTMHSFCYKILRYYENLKGRKFFLIEGGRKLGVLADIYRSITGRRNIDQEDLEMLINEISFVKNRMLAKDAAHKTTIRNFDEILRAYESYKRENCFIDFDDMLIYSYKILLKEPPILAWCRDRYKYLQVDEGQDTSKIQMEIIRLLSFPRNNLFIVADDDQSIYGFRGAEPENLLEMPSRYPECRVYHLDTNYRSSKNIVETTSGFIKTNQARFDKQHKTVNGYRKDPVIMVVKNEQEQIELLTKMVKNPRDKSIAIIYRNNMSSIAIVDRFDLQGIDFDLRQGSLHFFNNKLLLDIKAFFLFALNPKDRQSFLRICFGMNRYLTKKMVEHALACEAQHPSIIDAMFTTPDLKGYQVKIILGLKLEFESLRHKAPLEAIKYIQKQFNYSKKETVQNSTAVFSAVSLIASNCNTLMQFIERLDYLMGVVSDSLQQTRSSNVVLSTIHSCKGQEFDVVIMMDLVNDDFPGMAAMEMLIRNNDRTALEEERRLFYVGMTRAKEELYLISPKKRNGIEVYPTVFVQEVVDMKKNKTGDEKIGRKK